MASEMDELLNKLRAIKNNTTEIPNSKTVWSCIGQGDWSGAGFTSEEDMSAWIENNPYNNLS